MPGIYRDTCLPHSHPGTLVLGHGDFSPPLAMWTLGHYGLDLKLCWGPLSAFYPQRAQYYALSWQYQIPSREQPALSSHGALGCCMPSLYSKGEESFPFVLIPLSKEEKEKKEI